MNLIAYRFHALKRRLLFPFHKILAELGCGNSMAIMSEMYSTNPAYCPLNIDKAFSLAKRSAGKGNVHGLHAYATLLLNKDFPQCDPLKAMTLLQQAIDMGYRRAKVDMCYAYFIDYPDFPQDKEKAIELLHECLNENLMGISTVFNKIFFNNLLDNKEIDDLEHALIRDINRGSANALTYYALNIVASNNNEEIADLKKMKRLAFDDNSSLEIKTNIILNTLFLYKGEILYDKEIKKIYEYAQHNVTNALYAYGFALYHGLGIKADPVSAFSYFRRSLDAGYDRGHFEIGTMYLDGCGVAANSQLAFEHFMKDTYYDMSKILAARILLTSNDTDKEQQGVNMLLEAIGNNNEHKDEAMISLARYYKMKDNNDLYIKWIQRAAENGNSDSMVEYGVLLKNGQLVPQNDRLAIQMWEKAEEKGNINATYNLALVDINTRQTNYINRAVGNLKKLLEIADNKLKVDIDNTLRETETRLNNDKKYKEDLKISDPDATLRMALFHIRDLGFLSNHDKGMELMHKAADMGNVEAIFRLGIGYTWGDAFPVDYPRGRFYLEMAADKDFPPVFSHLGRIYRLGVGVSEIDLEKAIAYYEKGIELGDSDSMTELSYMYCNGDGLEVDDNKAFKLCSMAAEKGHAIAQYQLAKWLMIGVGCVKNTEKAISWFKASAASQYLPAIEALGIHYLEGYGCDVNYKEAFNNLNYAAQHGMSTAKYFLAKMFHNGFYVNQDINIELSLLHDSAKEGCAEAQNILACYYAKGYVVDANAETAEKLFEAAINSGSEEAAYNYAQLLHEGAALPQDEKKAIDLLMNHANKDDEKVKALLTEILNK